MKLRTKLLLGYAGFVLALGLLGAWSARTLSQMSAVSGLIISENYDSVVAAQDMKESLERQDSAAVFELIGEHDRARRQVAVHRARFDRALGKAAANITEPGEAEVIAAIRRGRDEYERRYEAVIASTGERTALYFSQLEPRFNALREKCDRLLRLNQEAMRRKAGEASQIARRWFVVTVVLAVALMAVGIGVQVSLSHAIVEPVRRLTEATTRVAAGDLRASVPVTSRDEIGALAAGFNRMAERIRELRQADYHNVSRLKSQFIASASRELRTPLTSVQMAIHALLEGSAGPLTAAQQDMLETSRGDAARLDHLMRGLLELSRTEAGAAPPAREPVRPSVLVGGAVEPLRLQLEARGVRLSVEAPPDLPHVQVDRDQIARVIAQLVSNASAATPGGGTVTVSAARAAGQIVIAVADTGAGIPRDDLAAVFEPFARVAASHGDGPGLGLAIARGAVEAHGGQLTAESSPGQGSTFTLTLPFHIQSAS